MPKPTTMTGWWKLLLDRSANGSVTLLAKLIGVSPRTLHRWQTSDIERPNLERRNAIRITAGSALLQHSLCPKYLKVKKPSAHAKTPSHN